jgi:hypothetical protein
MEEEEVSRCYDFQLNGNQQNTVRQNINQQNEWMKDEKMKWKIRMTIIWNATENDGILQNDNQRKTLCIKARNRMTKH